MEVKFNLSTKSLSDVNARDLIHINQDFLEVDVKPDDIVSFEFVSDIHCKVLILSDKFINRI